MIDVVLYQPEIPPNTGNVIRLCANLGCRLNLIEPLGFELDDRRLRRAGLDYREWADVRVHATLAHYLSEPGAGRLVALTTRASRLLPDFTFLAGDALLFGPETRGLPDAVLADLPEARRRRLPMRPGSRSLNLANSVAIACYEASRQLGFPELG